MAIGFPPRVVKEITIQGNNEEFLKDSERIFSELGWKTDKRDDNSITAYSANEMEFITAKTTSKKAFVESVTSGMKYIDSGKNLKNVNDFLLKYGVETRTAEPRENYFTKYFSPSPQVISIFICLFVAYPIVVILPQLVDLYRFGETDLLQDMVLGYIISWSVRIAAVFLLLKGKKSGWMLAFAFLIFNAIWMSLDFYYSYTQYYNENLDENTLFGLYNQFLYKGTGYYIWNIISNAAFAAFMLLKIYREYFQVIRQNIIAALAVGVIGGFIFTLINRIN